MTSNQATNDHVRYHFITMLLTDAYAARLATEQDCLNVDEYLIVYYARTNQDALRRVINKLLHQCW